MPCISLLTKINASAEVCFDLSRSIDLHRLSTGGTNEMAIGGTTKGLISLNESVTWRATHFGIRQNLTSKITAYDRLYFFRDEMTKGIFKSIRHDHLFSEENGTTCMKDIFIYQSPFGIAGKIFERLVLTAYLRRFLLKRNNVIRKYAESEDWRKII